MIEFTGKMPPHVETPKNSYRNDHGHGPASHNPHLVRLTARKWIGVGTFPGKMATAKGQGGIRWRKSTEHLVLQGPKRNSWCILTHDWEIGCYSIRPNVSFFIGEKETNHWASADLQKLKGLEYLLKLWVLLSTEYSNQNIYKIL